MRKPLVGLAGIALLVSACTTTSQSDPVTEAAPPDTAQATTVTTLPAPPSTTTTTAAPTTTVAPPTSTTAPSITTTSPPAATTTTTAPPEGTPILTEPAAAPDSFSASVVGGTPIMIPNNAQDVTISVDVVFQPDGYCETFFLFAICGWDFHETPTWPGSTFTASNVSVFTATETLPFPSSEGDSKIFYFTYGYGEFLGFGDSGNQTIAILVERASG